MQMMRKFYMLAAMTAVMAVSCKRASVSDDLPVIPQGRPLTVEASLDTKVTRTTLDTDGLTLLWEAGDQLAVYSSFIGSETSFQNTSRYNELNSALLNSGLDSEEIEEVRGLLFWIESASLYPEYQRNGILTVTDASAGSASGSFKSENSVFEWFGNSKSDEQYWFTAYYPAPSQEFLNAHPINSCYCNGEEEVNGVFLRLPWVMVNIPSVQDGKSWSRYQLVVCSGFDMLGFEADRTTHVPDMGGVVTQQGVLDGTEKISFKSFQPLTSLLHFDLKVASTAAEESYEIDKIVISQEASWDGERRSDLYALSGEVPYFILCNAPNRDYDTTLWNRYSAPYSVGNHLAQSPVAEGDPWYGSAGLCNTITLQFSDSQTVTKDGTGEEYYAVAIPTNANPYVSDYKNPVLIFKAYDASGEMILYSRMLTPNRKDFATGEEQSFGTGLEYGHKYDFTVTLNPSLDGSVGTSPGNAGSYGLGTL